MASNVWKFYISSQALAGQQWGGEEEGLIREFFTPHSDLWFPYMNCVSPG